MPNASNLASKFLERNSPSPGAPSVPGWGSLFPPSLRQISDCHHQNHNWRAGLLVFVFPPPAVIHIQEPEPAVTAKGE